MFHSCGQVKACMTSKQYTFENKVTFHFDCWKIFHGDYKLGHELPLKNVLMDRDGSIYCNVG